MRSPQIARLSILFKQWMVNMVIVCYLLFISDWQRTSLGKSISFFRSSFLQPLLKSCKVCFHFGAWCFVIFRYFFRTKAWPCASYNFKTTPLPLCLSMACHIPLSIWSHSYGILRCCLCHESHDKSMHAAPDSKIYSWNSWA